MADFNFDRTLDVILPELLARLQAAEQGSVTPTPTLGNLLASVSTGTVGTALSFTISGNTAGSTLSLIGTGAAGLSISGTTVSGTPTTVGPVGVRETLAGAVGSPKDNTGLLTIAAAVVKVTISGTPPTSGQVGVAYTFTPTVANGSGTKTFTLSSGTLLGGLSFNTGTGAISGTPTVAGTMSGLVVTVADSTGSASTTATTVTIAAATTNPITLLTVGSSTPDYGVTRNGSAADGDDQLTWSTDGVAFQRLNTGAYMQPLGKSLIAATGRPVRVIAKATGGQTMANIANDANGYTTGVINAVNAAGGADAVWMQAGFNDIANGAPVSKAAHLALIRQAISRIRTGTNLPNLVFFIGISQDKQFTPQLRYVREAEMAVILNDANVKFLVNQTDIETVDSIHMTPAGNVIAASRAALALNAYFTGATQKRGPRLVSATSVSSTTTDVTFQHRNGSDFSPATGALGFSAYDSTGALLTTSTVTADRQSATVMRVTHPAGAAFIDFGVEPLTNTNDPNMLKDNGTVPLPAEPLESMATITGVSVPLSVSGTPGGATVGQPYSYKPAVTGGSGTKTWAASGTALPAGLSLNTSTGEVSGTPTAAATTNGIVLNVTDSTGSASQTISIVVSSAVAGGLSDTFTDTDGTSLATHTSDSGQTWTVGTSSFVINNGRTYTTAAPANATSSWTPTSESYAINLIVDCVTIVAQNALTRFRIAGETTYYYAGLVSISGKFYATIGYTINGSANNASIFEITPSAGQQLAFQVTVPTQGGTIRLALNGTEVTTLADTRAELTAKGSIGIRQSVASASATTGFQFTSISANNF